MTDLAAGRPDAANDPATFRGRAVALPTGELVDSYSPTWRAHCEAVLVAGMHADAFEGYLAGVKRKRGDQAERELRHAALALIQSGEVSPLRVEAEKVARIPSRHGRMEYLSWVGDTRGHRARASLESEVLRAWARIRGEREQQAA